MKVVSVSRESTKSPHFAPKNKTRCVCSPKFEGKYTNLTLGILATGALMAVNPGLAFITSSATIANFFNDLKKEKNDKNKTKDSEE